MTNDLLSPCGVDCAECDKYPSECGGCRAERGVVWWLEYSGENVCPQYACCVIEKGYESCAACPDLPCAHFSNADPTKSDAENAEILLRQLKALKNAGS